MNKKLCALIAFSCFEMASATLRAEVVRPIGLAPGSVYQIIFSTTGITAATSAEISYYNDFVTTRARSAEDIAFAEQIGGPVIHHVSLPAGATWRAVGSTPTVDARDNAPSYGVPIYNTRGELVAASSIYTGSLLTPVRFDEFGSEPNVLFIGTIRTGTDSFGYGVPGLTLGSASGQAVHGAYNLSDERWIDAGTIRTAGGAALYALSGPITYLPEPSGIALVSSALLGLCALAFLVLRKEAGRR